MQPPQDPYSSYYGDDAPPSYPQGGADTAPQWQQRPLPGGASPVQQAPQPGYVPPAYGMPPPLRQPAPQTVGEVPQPAYPNPPMGAQGPANGNTVPPAPGGSAPASSHTVAPSARQPAYQPPKTGVPRKRRKSNRWAYWALAGIVVVFAVVAALHILTPGQVAYGFVEAGSLSSRFTGDALVVRDETVYTQDGATQIDYMAAEGSQVKRATAIATVYTSGFNLKELTKLSNYRNQIKEYHKVLISSATGDSRLITLMSKIRQQAMETQRLVQSGVGNLAAQEKELATALEDCRTYMRQKYPDDQKLNRLYDDETTQLNAISAWQKQFMASVDGLVSFYADGFETALNMDTYQNYSPTQVRRMVNGEIPETAEGTGRNAVPVYRIVREQPWAVLMLCDDREWSPVMGRSYELRIESFDNVTVQATVESFTKSGGELLVRLRVENTAVLPSVLYNRACQVTLGENVNTLMVPSRALMIQNGHKGVVISIDGGEYFARVEVLSDDGRQACIVPENINVLYEGVRVRLF